MGALEYVAVNMNTACRWLSHNKPGGRLPLLSARPAVTFPVKEHRCPFASTKLYCSVQEAHMSIHCVLHCFVSMAACPSLPCARQIQVMEIVWKLREDIIRTAMHWIVWHNVHTYVSSSYRSNKLFVTLGPLCCCLLYTSPSPRD